MTVSDDDSYDFVNLTIEVRLPGIWGFVETLSEVPTGTHDPVDIQLKSGTLRLIDADTDEESLVLQGALHMLSRKSLSNMAVVSYEPVAVYDGLGWNVSLELYATKEESAFRAVGSPASKVGLKVYLNSNHETLGGICLQVGDSGEGKEAAYIYEVRTKNWTEFSDDIAPACPNRRGEGIDRPELSDTLYGMKPDRYIASFRYSATEGTLQTLLYHTELGYIGSERTELKTYVDFPIYIQIETNTSLVSSALFKQCSYWVLDEISYRGLMCRDVTIDPVYEYVYKGKPAWLTVKEADGDVIDDAKVEICGQSATYNQAAKRYEAFVSLGVGWAHAVNYTVQVDGSTISDRILVTVMPDLEGTGVSLPLWWNGWDWVTVFGRDDSSSATTAADTYLRFSHPTTSYILVSRPSGTSDALLRTQSEIAIHYPHDYQQWPTKFWDEAVLSSDEGHAVLEKSFEFASRWDDPRYVGVGDTYISLASPGNSASWAQVFAQYARGTRIMGVSSNPFNGAPGNASLLGSWWVQTNMTEGASWAAPYSQWYPFSPLDLMDAARGPNTDYPLPVGEWNLTFWVAEHGGVRRVYNHGIISESAEALLNWMCDPKTNFSKENWKATDGEVASYVYGRWSTDVELDLQKSNATVASYRVSRADPVAAGYWRVPVTLAFNITGRILADITVAEGERTLSISQGTLRNLDGKRVMDVGYDIRGGTAYVSYFWNSSSAVYLTFSDEVPPPNSPPIASFVVDSSLGNITKVFVFDASPSSDAQDPTSELVFRWDWDGDGKWDTDWLSTPVVSHQFLLPGVYEVRLQVRDRGGLVGETSMQIEVRDVEVPEFGSLIPVIASVLATVLLVRSSRLRLKRNRPRR
ncbi:MAG: PKD domain-containing protein [Thermoplasmata archaeon]